MAHLLDALFLEVGEMGRVVIEASKGIVGRASQGNAALEAIGVVVHHAIESVGRAAHHHVPQQSRNMHVHRLHAACLTVIRRAVVALANHRREVAHRGLPFQAHHVGFGCERKGVLAVHVRQFLSEVGSGVVECQPHLRELRLHWLLLLVLALLLLFGIFRPLLVVHLCQCDVFAHPCLHDVVNLSLARSKVARYVGNQIQRIGLAVHVELHACCPCADGRADGGDGRHRQRVASRVDRLLQALCHHVLWYLVVVEQFVLPHRFVECLHDSELVNATVAIDCLSTQCSQHVAQPSRHLCALAAQCRVDTFHLLCLWEAVVARNPLCQQATVVAADVLQHVGKLVGQCVAIRLHWLCTAIEHLPVFADDLAIRNAQVVLFLR